MSMDPGWQPSSCVLRLLFLGLPVGLLLVRLYTYIHDLHWVDCTHFLILQVLLLLTL